MARLRSAALRLHPVFPAGWVAAAVLWAAAALGISPTRAAAQSGSVLTDTVTVVNRAAATYQDNNGSAGAAAASATVAVRYTTGAQLSPDRQGVIAPGARIVFAHTLRNTGSAADRFALALAAVPAGWTASVHVDVDGDSALGPLDSVTTSVTLASGAQLSLLVVVDVPSSTADSSLAAIAVNATSARQAKAGATATDRLTVLVPHARLALLKSVDRASATQGDTLLYTLRYENTGDAPSGASTLVADTLPAGAHYLAGSLALNGAARSDSAVVRLPDGRDLLRLAIGAVAPATRGSATLRATVSASSGAVDNVAHLEDGGTVAVSGTAETRLALADLALRKEVIGDTAVSLGGQLLYRLTYTNRSRTFWGRGLVLTDTLPAELDFLAASGAPTTSGRVVTWRLPDLAPGDSGQVTLTTRVVHLPDSARVVNRATVSGTNAVGAFSLANRVVVLVPTTPRLAITKTAGVLEVGLGEAVPYTVTLRNTGDTPLRELAFTDLLPEGTRFGGRVIGADSARAIGRTLTAWVANDLQPGTQLTLRYGVVLVSTGVGGRIANQVSATAERGRIFSDTATAWVRVRSTSDAETRMLVGKVWEDRNDNKIQDDDEPGVANVQVWSTDGEIAITDKEGRFSFRDVRPGSHTFRIDTVGVPSALKLPSRDEEVVTIRADGWTMPRVSFRLVPRAPFAATCDCAAPKIAQQGAPRDSVEARPRVAPLRTDSARALEVRQAIVRGPGIAFFEPFDGVVIHENRVYLGVRGEPNRPVRLYDGDSLLTQAQMRPDSVYDFVGVSVTPGPHHFRVAMVNSWNQERWDSLTVHFAGKPARFEAPTEAEATTLHVDAAGAVPLRVRVLDRWGAPVAAGHQVTVDVRGAKLEGADSDPRAPGDQRRVGDDGYLTLALKGGLRTGPGAVELRSGDARGSVGLRILPSIRPLIVTGAAQVAVGERAESYGQVTARGALDKETAISVSYDSHRSVRTDESFARDIDPLDPSRYPTVGDGSERRVLSASTAELSARVERGYDWLALGDVTPGAIVGSGKLFMYQRALTGLDGRVTTGDVVWRGFGSVTSQRALTRQLRASSGTGPYLIGRGVRPGSEVVAIEIRGLENAARLVSRQELVRYTDYDVDYESGTLLLRRVVPETDGFGNPVYIVVSMEQQDGGPARFTGGLRAELDASRLGFKLPGTDSLVLGLSALHDQSDATMTSLPTTSGSQRGLDVVGADARMTQGRATAELELLHAQHPDTGALAGRAALRWGATDDRLSASAEWTRVEQGFGGVLDPRLSAGLHELRLSTSYRFSKTARLELAHDRQRFDQYAVGRQNTYLRAQQEVMGRAVTQELGITSDQAESGGVSSAGSSATAKVQVAANDRLTTWVEGAHVLQESAMPSQPNRVGGGVRLRLFDETSLEATHQQISPTVGEGYTLSSLRLRTGGPLGGHLWGGVDRASAVRASNAAVLGFDQKLQFARAWELTGSYERRFGLDQAPLSDPNRALPFVQAEPDHWTASGNLRFKPGGDGLRANLLGEWRDQAGQRTTRLSFSSDAALGSDAALLARSDWLVTQRGLGNPGPQHDDRSLMGFAFRPTRSDAFNVLAKLEWRRSANALASGSLTDSLEQRRLIGATDAVWAVSPMLEVAGRYAARWSELKQIGIESPFAPLTHFAGIRVQRELPQRFAARLDGRLLHEQSSGASTWSLTPSLLYRLTDQLELEGGYRAGTLRDADFGQITQHFFASVGLHFTEHNLATAAAFWRDRLTQER